MENKQIARLLAETADLMEIAGADAFRIRSYRNAAAVIESHPERISDLMRDPERKVTDIAGIGKGMAAVLSEIEARGSFERRDEMLARYPAGTLELLKIQGLGPKSIALLYQHHGVQSIDRLERLCREHKLRELPRMGAKLEEKVLRSIQAYRRSAGRFLMSFGWKAAGELQAALQAIAGVEQVEAAGSLRRGRETIGDLDLLVCVPEPGPVMAAVAGLPRVHEVLGQGANKVSVLYGVEGLQVDVRALAPESFGAALQYFTGSKEHNVTLRTQAIKQGLSLNEYGLFDEKTAERVAGTREDDIYERLGYRWIPPELRENSGEFEAAAAGRLPRLVELGDVRGDLHMHTVESDGRATLEEMAETAARFGYEYIAITDHSKALAMANGLDERRAVEFAARVRRLNHDGLPLYILAGLECDIKRDGALDLAADALAELDFVVASVHSYFNLESTEMTDRLLRALECPSVRMLGHPTGRLLLQREGYPFDFDRVAMEAARRGVLLEINSSPERLDLAAPLVRTAKRLGCKFAITTDAHHPSHLGSLPFGIATARRGWLEASDIVNTLPLTQVKAALHCN